MSWGGVVEDEGSSLADGKFISCGSVYVKLILDHSVNHKLLIGSQCGFADII